jgi:arginyl-tRNA synthetase
MNNLESLKKSFFTFLADTFSLQPTEQAAITFTLNCDTAKTEFGDLSTNAAMILAKQLKSNPRTIAQMIVEGYKNSFVSSMQIAGPGFVNLYLTQEFFAQMAHQLFTQGEQYFKLTDQDPKEHFSIEFVSANPTGPLHFGHGRGGIIGDVLGTILSFLGHNVVKEFYINDAGAQIEKLGLSLKIRCQQLLGLDNTLPEEAYHGEYLKNLAQEFIDEFGDKALNQPEAIFSQFAQNRLLQTIKKTLEIYGITYNIWFSEKTLHDSGAVAQALELLKQKGFTYVHENAIWFKSTEFGDDKDRVLKKGQGNYTYISADIAYLQNKLHRGFSKIIMILGQDHHSYVTRMKAMMQALGNNPEDLSIILYQLVSLKEGGQQVRMSKRAGAIVDLQEVIEYVGKDVARFFYLHRKADAHLEFDLALALKKTEENPVYYIQYAYVRAHSILEKASLHNELASLTPADLKELGHDEIQLLKKIVELKDLLKSISHNYQTHLLAYYVIELAHAFHRYYSKNRVINLEAPTLSRTRLACIQLLNKSFKLCLDLLGLDAPTSM